MSWRKKRSSVRGSWRLSPSAARHRLLELIPIIIPSSKRATRAPPFFAVWGAVCIVYLCDLRSMSAVTGKPVCMYRYLVCSVGARASCKGAQATIAARAGCSLRLFGADPDPPRCAGRGGYGAAADMRHRARRLPAARPRHAHGPPKHDDRCTSCTRRARDRAGVRASVSVGEKYIDASSPYECSYSHFLSTTNPSASQCTTT